MYTVFPYYNLLVGHNRSGLSGELFAKSYDKNFKRKKKRRKIANVSKKRNRKF